MPRAGKLEVELETEKFVQAVKRIGPSIGPSFGTATGIKLSIILQEAGRVQRTNTKSMKTIVVPLQTQTEKYNKTNRKRVLPKSHHKAVFCHFIARQGRSTATAFCLYIRFMLCSSG